MGEEADVTEQEKQVLEYLQLIYCLLSLLGCCFIIISFVIVKIAKKLHYNFVLGLALSQLVVAISGITSVFLGLHGMKSSDNIIFCNIQGSIVNVAEKAGWIYVSLITWNMVLQTNGYKEETIRRYETKIHCFCWFGTTFLFVPILLFHYGLGPFPFDICWTQKQWVIASVYVPLPIFLIFNAVCLIYIVYVYTKDFRDFKEVHTPLLVTRNATKMRSFLWRISFYPLFSFLIYFSVLVAQISIDMKGPAPEWTGYVSQWMYLEGFLCAVAYGFTPSLRSKYNNFFKSTISGPPTWPLQNRSVADFTHYAEQVEGIGGHAQQRG